jgi:hypothetical protein
MENLNLPISVVDLERLRAAINAYLSDIDQAINSNRYSVWLAEQDLMEGIDAEFHRNNVTALLIAQVDYTDLLLHLTAHMPKEEDGD